jgi:hypothetical protein
MPSLPPNTVLEPVFDMHMIADDRAVTALAVASSAVVLAYATSAAALASAPLSASKC